MRWQNLSFQFMTHLFHPRQEVSSCCASAGVDPSLSSRFISLNLGFKLLSHLIERFSGKHVSIPRHRAFILVDLVDSAYLFSSGRSSLWWGLRSLSGPSHWRRQQVSDLWRWRCRRTPPHTPSWLRSSRCNCEPGLLSLAQSECCRCVIEEWKIKSFTTMWFSLRCQPHHLHRLRCRSCLRPVYRSSCSCWSWCERCSWFGALRRNEEFKVIHPCIFYCSSEGQGRKGKRGRI